MTKNLPKIYKNTVTSDTGNNKKAFYSFKDERKENKTISNESIDNENINIESIEALFNNTVEITTKEFTVITKIVSKLNDHILTSDNRIILLSDIKKIIVK